MIALYKGDAIDALKCMADNSIDLIVTDPPYRTISGGKKPAEGFGWHVSVVKENDGKIFKHNDVNTKEYLTEFYRVLKPGKDCYVMTNNLNLREMLNIADEVGFKFHNLLLWVKNTATANRWYMKNVEYTLYLYKPPARMINNRGSKQTHFADNPRNKLHPTQKPLSLFKEYIENSSDPGDLVLDPFMGCGTAAVVCDATGRNFIGYELDEEYYRIAQQRVCQSENSSYHQ